MRIMTKYRSGYLGQLVGIHQGEDHTLVGDAPQNLGVHCLQLMCEVLIKEKPATIQTDDKCTHTHAHTHTTHTHIHMHTCKVSYLWAVWL